MLLDDVNPRKNDCRYLALSDHPNIELKLFNPSGARQSTIMRGVEILLRLFALTCRMHNKAWIADNGVAIVGGRNVGDAYFDAAETNFRNLDVLLLGPAVQQTAKIFEAFWACEAAKPIGSLGPAPDGTHAISFEEGGPEITTKLLSTIGDPGVHRGVYRGEQRRSLGGANSGDFRSSREGPWLEKLFPLTLSLEKGVPPSCLIWSGRELTSPFDQFPGSDGCCRCSWCLCKLPQTTVEKRSQTF